MPNLLDSTKFIPLANLVASKGIKNFVEVDTKGATFGAEAAARLMLNAHIHDPHHAEDMARRFPEFDVYDGDSLSFLRHVTEAVDGPTYFYLDPNAESFDDEMELLQSRSEGKEWYVDFKADPVKTNPFDRSESGFDRQWAGPPEMRPKVYRTQSEKDTWFSIYVENEYQLGELSANDLVVDIGAHIGSFCALAHRMGSRRILGFEVDPWHLEGARGNVEDLEGIGLFHMAVVRGDDKRKPVYHYNGDWSTFNDDGIEVESISLDEIIDSCGPIRFLKIDCEGSEWPILYTCTKLDQIEEIAGEYHEKVDFRDDSLPPTNIQSLAVFLFERGFKGRWTNNVPGIGNFYFKRS